MPTQATVQTGQQLTVKKKVPTEADARALVKRDIEYPDCFIVDDGARKGWRPLTGTGCAHYVSHVKGYTGGAAGEVCQLGYKIRVTHVLAGKATRNFIEARVGDLVRFKQLNSHVGIVSELQIGPIPVPAPRPPIVGVQKVRVTHNSTNSSGTGRGLVSPGDWLDYTQAEIHEP